MRQCRRCPGLYADSVESCPVDGSALGAPDPVLGAVIDSRYRVELLLGRGGMGAVYRAEQLLLGRTVAIKVLRRLERDGAGEARFRREAMAVARLKHPNIVTCHDFGVCEQFGAYLVLEYVQGCSLREELDRFGRLPLADAADIAVQAALAADEAHAKGVVHRDLKPENILVERAGASVSVKVLDFGIAHLVESSREQDDRHTSDDFVVGTPAYMSPEQCDGADVDGRSDIYSLGCMLYEMLTGRPPFTGATSTLVFARHQTEVPEAPSALLPELPETVDRVVLRALEKDRDRRFASGTELAVELQLALHVPLSAVEAAVPRPPAVSRYAVGRTAPRLPQQAKEAGLQIPATRFVGRDRMLAETLERVRASRLVTLAGIGGIGKTRLALEAASRLADSFADGVAVVAIESLTRPDLVAGRIAAVLGVREQTGRPLLSSIGRAIGRGQLLLVLDNCEHLVDECVDVAVALLADCPRLHVLATSQVPLGVEGECLLRIGPLEVPAGRSRQATDSVAASDAGRLFLDRVRRARPDFELTRANASTVATILRRLDGIPLAIELAAARARVMSIDEIAARLEVPVPALPPESGRELSRHASLEATLEWSYGLLPPVERILLRRLAVFLGGFTVTAATAVASGGELAASAVPPLLDTLAARSLVTTEPSASGPVRYGMLSTIRDFCYRKLAAAGEAGRFQATHADYFLHEVEIARRFFYGPGEREWVEYLESELENLRMALEWSQSDEYHPVLGLKLAAALGRFFEIRGHWIEGRRWLDGARTRDDALSPALHGELLYWLGVLSLHQGCFEWARAYFRAALELLREVRDEAGQTRVLRQLALALRYLGDSQRAEIHLCETLASARVTGDQHGAAQSLLSLSMLASDRADLPLAITRLEEALEIARAIGDQVTLGMTLMRIGEIAARSGDICRAERALCDSLALGHAQGSRDIVADSSAALGRLATGSGDIAVAARWYLKALSIYRRLGNKRGITVVLEGVSCLMERSGAHDHATVLAAAADASRRAIHYAAYDRPDEPAGAARDLLRAALGPAAFSSCWQRGLAATLEEAVRDTGRLLASLGAVEEAAS